MKRISIIALAAALLIFAGLGLPIREMAESVFSWIQENPNVSWLVFLGLYILATVLLLPGSVLTIGGGWLFGFMEGLVVVSLSSTLAASCSFLIGRYLARAWVEGKISEDGRYRSLDRAIGERGFFVVLLTRLSPLFPYNLLNYAWGISSVRISRYVLASWIGMIPGTLLYVYLGAAASDISQLFSVAPGKVFGQEWLVIVGLAATAVLVIFIARLATKSLNQVMEKGNASG